MPLTFEPDTQVAFEPDPVFEPDPGEATASLQPVTSVEQAPLPVSIEERAAAEGRVPAITPEMVAASEEATRVGQTPLVPLDSENIGNAAFPGKVSFIGGVPVPAAALRGVAKTGLDVASSMTSPEALALTPWFFTPGVGQGLGAAIGIPTVVEGTKQAATGLGAGDLEQTARGATLGALGATMLGGSRKLGLKYAETLLPKAVATLKAGRGIVESPGLPSQSGLAYTASLAEKGASPSGVAKPAAAPEPVSPKAPVLPIAETAPAAEAASPDARLDAAVKAIADATESGRPVDAALLTEYEAAKAAIAPKPVDLKPAPAGAFEEMTGIDPAMGRWWTIKEGEYKSSDGGTYRAPDRVSEGQMRMLGFEPPPKAGMGAANLGELEPGARNPTAAANRIVNEDRVARGQQELLDALRKDDPTQVAEAAALLDRDPAMPERLATELVSNARPISDVEGHVLTLRRQELRRSHARALDEVIAALDDKRTADLPRLQSVLADYEAKLTQIEAAQRAAGSELGRGLRSRQVLINEDFSVEGMIARARAAKEGKPLENAEAVRVREYALQLRDLRTKLDKALAGVDAQNVGKRVDAAIRGFRKGAPRRASPVVSTDALQAARVVLAERVKAGKPEGLGNIAQRLARLFVEQNLKITRDELVSKVHAEIAALDPAFTVRDTADAISGYGKFTPLNKGAVETVLRDLKDQLREVSKIAAWERGEVPKRTGREQMTPSAEGRALRKQEAEAKRKSGVSATDPATQLKSALDAIKTRLRNQIEDLNRQIATRTQVVRERTGVEYDAEAVGLREWRDALKEVYDQTFVTPEMAEAARMATYRASVERRIAEYERRIRDREFDPKPRRQPPTTPEALNLQRKLADAQRKWLQELADYKFATMPSHKRVMEHVFQTTRGQRKWLSSFDISMLGRQGGPVFLTHPTVAAKAVLPSMKAFANEKYALKVENEILTRPNYVNGLYGKSGLRLVDSRGSIAMREEVFAGQTWADYMPGVKGSERAYNTFLNLARADWFDLQVASLSRTGTPTIEEAAAVANLINKFTGYGGVKGSKASYGIMSDLLWSPRFLLSRFQMIAHTPVMGKMTPRTRKALMGEYVRLYVGIGSTLGMLNLFNTINWNPLSSDFGKLRDGDTRIDLLMGLSQVLVFMSRSLRGKRMTGGGDIRDIRGEDADYGAGDVGDVIFDFAVSKLAPSASTVISSFKGEYPGGDPVNLENMGKQLLVPLGFQELVPLWEAHGLPKGTFYNLLGLSGAGVQVHDNQRPLIFPNRRPPLRLP